MKPKQRVPALRGGQPGDLAANRGPCDRISLRVASKRRKIAPNNLGIWEMPVSKPGSGGRGWRVSRNFQTKGGHNEVA
jgi:hypothetical protein